MDDKDIWRSAKVLTDRYRDDAVIHAATRSVELLRCADTDGAATWRRIIGAIKELQNTEPDGPVH